MMEEEEREEANTQGRWQGGGGALGGARASPCGWRDREEGQPVMCSLEQGRNPAED